MRPDSQPESKSARSLEQPDKPIATLPSFDFETWASQVRQQMVEALKKRTEK